MIDHCQTGLASYFVAQMVHKRKLLNCLLLVAAFGSASCSIKNVAMNQLGDALSGGGTAFSSDEDPELVGDALPFSLKLMESVLAETPRHEALLGALASGFTQYAYGYVQLDADEIEDEDYDRALELRDRAKNLYLRAKGYGMRSLEVAHPGFEADLIADKFAALERLGKEDVETAYWTALAWSGAIVLSLDDPQILGELAYAEAMMDQIMGLDPDWEYGTLHGFFVTYEMSRLGGEGDPVEKATRHFQRAKELSGGNMASCFVAMAESVAVEKGDKELFVSLLNQALAIDIDVRPDWRLSNLIYQRRAKWLLTRLDWYFF